MRIRLYLDEDVPYAFALALLNRGIDIITTQQMKNDSLSDAEQLYYAAKERRAIFTHNKKDFILLHNEYLQNKRKHSGIILSNQIPTGMLLRRFMKLWFTIRAEDMESRIEFLSNWK